MAIRIGRRQFISALGGAALAWPLAARAQQTAMPVVGYLNGGSERNSSFTSAFKQGLAETGYVEGKNVTIEYRFAESEYDRLPAMAADLVRHQVNVIAAGTPVAALEAKRATTSIPIVFALGSDPVHDGLVGSLGRPGGNITGATFFSNLLDAKLVELLHEVVPNAQVFAVLLNPKNANFELEKADTQQAMKALGLQLVILQASTPDEIDTSFAELTGQHAAALMISGDSLFYLRRAQIAQLALRHGIPASAPNREQAAAGVLISYGSRYEESYRQAGNYTGRILRGEKPGDLPVQQPTKFQFVINMTTAKTLGLAVPNSMQLLADEVIE